MASAHNSPRTRAWQEAYQAVLKETETRALFKLVEVAEAEVRTRQAALEGSADHHAERISLEEAVAHLQFVKRERLNFR